MNNPQLVYFSSADTGGSQNYENLGLDQFQLKLHFVRKKWKMLLQLHFYFHYYESFSLGAELSKILLLFYKINQTLDLKPPEKANFGSN